jgi:hypothetical protein
VAPPLAGYDSSPIATEVTRKTTCPSSGGSPALIDATSRTTSAPAGISAPFVPWTGAFTVAVIRSPGRLLRVQTREFELAASTVPAPIAPAPDSPARSVGCAGCGAGASGSGGGASATRVGRRVSRCGVGCACWRGLVLVATSRGRRAGRAGGDVWPRGAAAFVSAVSRKIGWAVTEL